MGAPGMAPLGAEGSWGLLGSQQVCAQSCSSELVPSPEPGRKERWENPKSQHLSHSRDGYRDGISTCISHIQHIQPFSHIWDGSEWDFHIQPLSHSQDGSWDGISTCISHTQPLSPIQIPTGRWERLPVLPSVAEDVLICLVQLFGTAQIHLGIFPLPPPSRTLTPGLFSKPICRESQEATQEQPWDPSQGHFHQKILPGRDVSPPSC